MLLYKIIRIFVLVTLTPFEFARAERRITDGKIQKIPKRFMVYLVRAGPCKENFDAWICGGAIVSKNSLISAAACLEDVQYMYAIAGYHKYVRDLKIMEDECTKNGKKKVIFTCAPKNYQFVKDKTEMWSKIDIGVAKVDSEFDFTKTVPGCSYAPSSIEVNYNLRVQAEGREVYILGWGHTDKWRKPNDKTDYNEKQLMSGSTIIMNKDTCQEAYGRPETIHDIIQRFMICTQGPGNIDADGNPEPNSTEDTGVGPDGCTEEKLKRGGYKENDHGGPLVTFIGGKEKLIGVASLFLLDRGRRCVGPSLFTSTACTAPFLQCILNGIVWDFGCKTSNKTRLRQLEACSRAPEVIGFNKISLRTISWKDHPDGPAKMEFTANDFVTNSTLKNKMIHRHITYKGLKQASAH